MDCRVVDSRTRKPVAETLIAIHDHPTTNTKSDADGRFHFSDYHNYHLGLAPGICARSWPDGQRWSHMLDISHPSYKPLTVNPAHGTYKGGVWTRDDIPLVRIRQ